MKNTGTKPIRTERLLLRKMHLYDYFAFSSWYRLPELALFSQRQKDAGRAECFGFLLRKVYNYYLKRRRDYYAWALIIDGKMAGFVEMKPGEDDIYAIYYMLSPAYQGQGYMKEAVNAVIDYLKTQRCRAVLGNCDSNNIASFHILQACGFRYLGRVEDYYHYRDGRSGDRERFVYVLKPKNNENA